MPINYVKGTHMARRASVRYWSSRGTWIDDTGASRPGAYCCTLHGKQHVLAAGPDDSPHGPTYQKAVKEFAALVCLEDPQRAGDKMTARVVLELYLRHIEKKLAANTYRLRRQAFRAFCCSEMGDMPLWQITPFMVDRWLEAQREVRHTPDKHGVRRRRGWGDSTIRLTLIGLNAAFNWAVKQELISKNPTSAVSPPSSRSRARWLILDHAAHLRVLNAAARDFKPVVVCLENSGCRPGELAMATAAAWDAHLGALVYHGEERRLRSEEKHKTARKGRERRIYFSGDALAVMRELVKQHPTGPLFRFQRAVASTANIVARFQVLQERLSLPHLTAYTYRHTFATRWLESGGSIDDLAALLGNSPDVIRKHYAHLLDNPDRLRQLAERFKEGRSHSAAETAPPPQTLPFRAAE